MKRLATLKKIKEELLKNNFSYNKKLKNDIDLNKDACIDDVIIFQQAIFGGSWKKPKFLGYNTRICKVLNESYGAEKQQHTFTLKDLENQEEFRIKGRNIYGNGFARIKGNQKEELARVEIATEKHTRGDIAREMRKIRKSELENIII